MQLLMNVFHLASGSCFSEKPERLSGERFLLDIQKQFCVCLGSSLRNLCDWLKTYCETFFNQSNQTRQSGFHWVLKLQLVLHQLRYTIGLKKPRATFSSNQK